MNIAFVCSETDAARIQNCLWHGFYDYCEGGFNGEQQIKDWQKSIMILHNALVTAKEGDTEVPERAEQLRTNLKRYLQQLEKCKKDHTGDEK